MKARGVKGFFKREDGTLKKGNTLKAVGGVAAAGTVGWMMLDPNADDKIGGAFGNLGNSLGAAGGGLLGGLFSGLGGILSAIMCILCSCSVAVFAMTMMKD